MNEDTGNNTLQTHLLYSKRAHEALTFFWSILDRSATQTNASLPQEGITSFEDAAFPTANLVGLVENDPAQAE
jgi:predicted 3-demethylubiquinone-9 3-methyltransferase (glyoxalase superfamily)